MLLWVWAGGCEEVSEVRAQAGFSLCVSELLEGAGRGYFSLVWHFRPGMFVLGSPECGDLTLECVSVSVCVIL